MSSEIKHVSLNPSVDNSFPLKSYRAGLQSQARRVKTKQESTSFSFNKIFIYVYFENILHICF